MGALRSELSSLLHVVGWISEHIKMKSFLTEEACGAQRRHLPNILAEAEKNRSTS